MDIDVVIPWVDPTDKEWQASKNKFLEDLIMIKLIIRKTGSGIGTILSMYSVE